MLCLGSLLIGGVQAADLASGVRISEFMADNHQGLRDENGEAQPWIELHNASTAAINFNGWSLTDTATNLTKWRFPGVVLLPDKYLVLFGSGKNRTNNLAHLHTSFRLSKQGNYLALVDPRTNVVSDFPPVMLGANVSYGRVPGEPQLHGRMPQPTPGRPNPGSGTGFAPEVRFSRAGGTFTAPFTLRLSAGPAGAVIRYTLDGTLPSSRSAVYAQPFQITNTAWVRTRCYMPGFLPGPPHSEGYIKLSTNVLGFSSSLPVLVMDTFGINTPISSHGSFVHLSLYEPVNGRTSLTNPPTLRTRGAFHVRGSSTSTLPQTPFALKLLDEFNEEARLPLLGLPADPDWILYAPNVYDPVMIHNPFIFELSRELGRYSPRTKFLEVYLVRSIGALKETNYHGIYVLTEKIKAAKQRVNIDRLGPDDLEPPNVTGGYIMKFDRLGPGEHGFEARGDSGIIYVEPKEQVMMLPQRAPQREYLKSFLDQFNQALHGWERKDPINGYRAFLDVDAAIDFHVLEVLSGNVDAMYLSTYFYKPRNGKIICGPHWDFDRALGSTDSRDANPRQWVIGPFFGGDWWPWLFRDADFWQAWVDRWQELRLTHFSLTNMNALVDRLCNELREAQPREYAKWYLQPRGGSYQTEINHMKKWLSNRVDFIDSELVQPPRLELSPSRALQPGSLVSLIAPKKVTVYYTLDGSDPRRPGGKISKNALVCTNSIRLEKGIQITARAYDSAHRQTGGPPLSTPWSRPLRQSLP
jgi:hypothetical protein